MGATGFVFLGRVNDSQGGLLLLFAEVSPEVLCTWSLWMFKSPTLKGEFENLLKEFWHVD